MLHVILIETVMIYDYHGIIWILVPLICIGNHMDLILPASRGEKLPEHILKHTAVNTTQFKKPSGLSN